MGVLGLAHCQSAQGGFNLLGTTIPKIGEKPRDEKRESVFLFYK
jgi:hypothetical protein